MTQQFLNELSCGALSTTWRTSPMFLSILVSPVQSQGLVRVTSRESVRRCRSARGRSVVLVQVASRELIRHYQFWRGRSVLSGCVFYGGGGASSLAGNRPHHPCALIGYSDGCSPHWLAKRLEWRHVHAGHETWEGKLQAEPVSVWAVCLSSCRTLCL